MQIANEEEEETNAYYYKQKSVCDYQSKLSALSLISKLSQLQQHLTANNNCFPPTFTHIKNTLKTCSTHAVLYSNSKFASKTFLVSIFFFFFVFSHCSVVESNKKKNYVLIESPLDV
jgi:cystathionine beta-lyase/cystathionine gamma-synthase